MPNELFEQSGRQVIKTAKDLSIKNLFNVTNRETYQNHGQKFKRIGVSNVTYTAAANDFLIGVTSLVSASTIGLPDPRSVGMGKHYIIKDEVGGAGTTTITIHSEGEKTIDGTATSTLTTNYEAKQFYTDGANWFTI